MWEAIFRGSERQMKLHEFRQSLTATEPPPGLPLGVELRANARQWKMRLLIALTIPPATPPLMIDTSNVSMELQAII
jgi:hypothetical protein